MFNGKGAMHRGLRNRAAATVLAVAGSVGIASACTPPGTGPFSLPGSNSLVNLHEFRHGSPLGFGYEVPVGAVQVGPLMRYRSEELREAYRAELEEALTTQATSLAERSLREAETTDPDELAEAAIQPEPAYERPRDTYRLIDQQPRPDVVETLLRVDGHAGEVFIDLLSQTRAILPDTNIEPAAWDEYCNIVDDRVERCAIETRGTASNGHELEVSIVLNLGDLSTRTTPHGAETRPLVFLRMALVGDPREAQVETGGYEHVPFEPSAVPDPDAHIWPQMDLDEDGEGPLLDGTWEAPDDAVLLITNDDPQTIVLFSNQGQILEQAGRAWVTELSDLGEPVLDIVEDLNEYSSTYTARSSVDGLLARATYVQSARGSYLIVRYDVGDAATDEIETD